MKIKVIDDAYGDVIYNGDADEFLYENDMDEELIEVLTSLEYCKYGDSVTYYSNQSETYSIIKDIELVY